MIVSADDFVHALAAMPDMLITFAGRVIVRKPTELRSTLERADGNRQLFAGGLNTRLRGVA